MYDFKEKEKKILDFWHDHNIYEKSLQLREKAKRFVFFEGPPSANGHAHMGHFIGRSFKDLFCRYKAMRGFFVLRKAGWDTHGLPIELQVEKSLGIKNKKEIEAYGVAEFNRKARETVWEYKQEWEELTKRMGFWLDTKNPYITYESSYVESVWSIVKEIYDKNLLFKAHKVVPFCTRCGTPLSSHEVAQGYQTVIDRSVYIKFKLTKGQKIGGHLMGGNTYILAWTTTPWTLPGNVALAIGKDINYSLVKVDKDYVLIASELSEKVLGTVEAVSQHKGSDLVGLSYEPLFEIKELASDKSYKIYDADFVSTTDGTGVVHTAVMYGEDDYNLGTQLELPKVHTVNELGKFVGVSSGLDGKYVKAKETEDLIIQYLTDNHNLLKTENYEHEYPFCWRCETPLLYYAKSSWFIKSTAVRDQMVDANNSVNWVPEHIKDGRMGQWLKDIKDWSISRERYWGTPLPIWECTQCEHRKVVGSYSDIEKHSISKKNSYYLMRHSLSGRNEKEDVILNSRLEADSYHLTEDGKKIVQEVAEGLKSEDIDFIFTSPFNRTKETAQIVGKVLHVEVVEDERLREVGHSLECEGKPRSLCPIKDQKYNPFHDNGHDHENWHHLRKRLQSFMDEMEEKYSKKKILVISHGDPLKVLSYIGQGFSEKEVLETESKEDNWYPRPAGLYHLKWRNIPRNEEGELDPHRPFIDKVAFKCTECKATMKKIPDLMDVWFDSGAMPFAQWHWPFENKKMQKEQYPADFIVEGIDQTRGWFYTMLAIATLLEKPAPYKNVMVLTHVLDDKGKKMSKSKGNMVVPSDVIEKTGVDAARWYFYTINSPSESKLFAMKDVELKLRSFIWTLNNCMRFLSLYSPQEIGNDYTPKTSLDKWIFSRLHHLIADVMVRLDAYDSMGAARAIDAFVVEDISNWWLRRSRKRKEALPILKYLLLEISRLLAPFTPFIAEEIYLSLNGHELFNQPSVHLTDWPKASKRLMNPDLEKNMDIVRDMVTKGLALRKEKQLKVRQPLRSATLKLIVKFKGDLENLLKDELNVKKILYSKDAASDVELDAELDAELIAEGYARELIRQLQDARKEAGYQVSDEAIVAWHSEDAQVTSAIIQWADAIKKDVVLKDFTQRKDSKTFDVEKESDLAPGKKIWFGIIK